MIPIPFLTTDTLADFLARSHFQLKGGEESFLCGFG